MVRNRKIQLAHILTCVLCSQIVWAQNGPTSGLYEITSGKYSECCGFAGNDFGLDLPDPSQKYLRFNVDSQTNTASMTFLGEDARTVFSRVSCSPSAAINFS